MCESLPSISEVKVSIALVTRNRPESLDRCLKSLRKQNLQPFEVVVSDDSDPEIAPKTATIAKRWNCHYITGPRRGLYANRNHAALACKGTHIRTMDDDHEFPADHCAITQATIEADPNSVWIFGEYHEKPNNLSQMHLPGEIQPRGYSNVPHNSDNCFALSDGACIYPRKVFEDHRYLEIFKFGNTYLEFGARLNALGYRIRFCKNTYIIHNFDPKNRSFNDENLQKNSSFFAAYLTYFCYQKSFFRQLECLGYFFFIALFTTLRIQDFYFNIHDFFKTWRLARKYKGIFELGDYTQMI